MNPKPRLFPGIVACFATSAVVALVVPSIQLSGLDSHFDQDTNQVYPVKNDQGRDVYVAEGCIQCHSQQVRDPQNGLDIERGWGGRRTVARDHVVESTPLLGSSRMGPDLANVGSLDWRNEPKEDPRRPKRRDSAWHLLHLYQPDALVKESSMPPYRYLFEKQPISGERSALAIDVPTERGYQIVPKPEAVRLVKYLTSLDRSYPLREAKAPAAK